jgi:uncharacterized protein YndB with AHSA1/START domain
VADPAAHDDAVVLERELDAPVELVWRMWIDPDDFAAWYGPDGANVQVEEMDVRVGGTRRVRMEVAGPEGPMQMGFVGEHVEIDEPRRLVYSESMAGPDGSVSPPHTRVVVELEDLGGRTRLVLTHHGVPADSPGATGWAMALEALGARLPG